nr:MAG TPA: hypothetical protein [Caudoviricetes sp.]
MSEALLSSGRQSPLLMRPIKMSSGLPSRRLLLPCRNPVW